MRSVRTLLILNYEYPPVGGGAGQVARSLCSCFARKGVEQIVITGWAPGLSFFDTIDKIRIIRVPMLKLRRDRTSVWGMASYIITAFFPLIYLLATRRIDAIHAHFVVPVGTLALAAKKLFGTPYIVTMHGGDVPGMVPEQTDSLFRWAKGAAKAVIRNADVVTAVSTGLADLAAKGYGERPEAIPNGIDKSWIDENGLGRAASSAECRLVFAARLTEQKNAASLIEAFKQLGGSVRWRLDILGDGPLMNELRDAARGAAGVTFHGWVPEAEVKRILSEADIFVLPSFSEGLSIAALQAMARGCALVVSDIPMNRDILEESVNGFFCRHSPESIAAAIERCLPIIDELKSNSQRKACSFLWEDIGDVYLKRIEDIVERKRKNISCQTHRA